MHAAIGAAHPAMHQVQERHFTQWVIIEAAGEDVVRRTDGVHFGENRQHPIAERHDMRLADLLAVFEPRDRNRPGLGAEIEFAPLVPRTSLVRHAVRSTVSRARAVTLASARSLAAKVGTSV